MTLEFRSADEIHSEQFRRLRLHLDYLAARSPFYQRRFRSHGVALHELRTLDDLSRLPFTTKADLEAHNDDLLCVPEREIVDLCQTSGTTGKPVVLLQTDLDLDRLAENEARSFASTGITADDRVIIACALGRNFMAGMAYFLGVRRLGAMAIRTGSDSLPLIMDSLRRYRPTTLVSVPSLAMALADRLRAEGDDPGAFGLRRIIGIGEPVRNPDLSLNPLGGRLRQSWGAEIFGTYASTEMATAFCDCTAGRGGHLLPDLLVVEIVGDDGRPVPPGTPGEVVATPLGVTGMPLLRLRTGDVCVYYNEPCPCGRNSLRLGPVLSRKNQMLKIRGCTVYPPAIFTALQEFPQLQGAYIEAHADFDLSDRVRLVVGCADPDLSALTIADTLAARLRVRLEVEIATPAAVQEKINVRDRRKPVTFFDFRKKDNQP